ncbi:MAG: excisionase [Ahrensia sp.]|nr:excisionase [Ahrensia sp.]
MPGADRLISTREAAEVLGVSSSYLAKSRLTGEGPRFIKIGARVLYRPSDLDAWLSERSRSSTAEYDAAS